MAGRKWLVWGMVVWMLAACGASEPAQGTERYTVDFTTTDAWDGPQSNTPNTSFTLEPENGHFRAGANTEDYAFALHTDDHTNIIIETRPRLATDNPNNGYGIGCRAQADGAGYWFLVSRDGYAAILSATAGGTVTNLTEWRYNDVIDTGANARNTLRATCFEDQLIFTVNGERVAGTSDNTHVSGATALVVSGSEVGPTNVVYESVTAWDVAP